MTAPSAPSSAPPPQDPAGSPASAGRTARWRELFVVEASGVRTGLAAALPFLVGQAVGYPGQGLVIGLGGLYVAITDKNGATLRTLLVATVGVSLAALAGALIGGSPDGVAVPVTLLVAFAMGLLGAAGDVAGNLGYAVTLVFAVTQGIPAPLRGGLEHLAEFAAGGIWATLLTLLLWRFRRGLGDAAAGAWAAGNSPPAAAGGWGAALRASLTPRSPVFWHALRLAAASALAVAFYRALHLEHGYWMLLTVLVIVKPDYEATQQRAYERVLGSVVGGALAVAVVVAVRSVVALDVLLVVFAVLAFSHSPRNYGLYTLFLTPFVVLMLDIAVPGDWQVALTRILNTLAGAALALCVAFLLRSPEERGVA